MSTRVKAMSLCNFKTKERLKQFMAMAARSDASCPFEDGENEESSFSCLIWTKTINASCDFSMLKLSSIPLLRIGHGFQILAIAHSFSWPFLWFCIINSSIHPLIFIFDFGKWTMLCFFLLCYCSIQFSILLLFKFSNNNPLVFWKLENGPNLLFLFKIAPPL